MRVAARLASILCLWLGGPVGASHAQMAARLSDPELDAIRGGFITAGGFTFDFGAVVSTYVDGSLALKSTLSLSAQGATVSNTYGAIPGAQPASAKALGGISLAGAPGASVVIPGAGGDTAVVQDVSPSSLVNLVVNTANNQVIRQSTAITLTLANMQALQAAAAQSQLAAQIQDAFAAAPILRSR